MARINVDAATRPYRAWSVNGSTPVGTTVWFNREKWIIYSWSAKSRVMILVNENAWVGLLNPNMMIGR